MHQILCDLLTRDVKDVANSPSYTHTAMKNCIFTRPSHIALALHSVVVMLLSGTLAFGADHAPAPHGAPSVGATPIDAASAHASGTLTSDIQKALKDKKIEQKKVTLVISDAPEKPAAHSAKSATAMPREPFNEQGEPAVLPPRLATREPASHTTARRAYKAKVAAKTSVTHDTYVSTGHTDVHWSYSGPTGPQAWGQLQPEFFMCGIGKRQSPINIETSATLQGPAEPLQFNYRSSSGTVINNGHSIQVDVSGENTLTVRGSVYKLLQFHFHSPSEEQVNSRSSAMVAHLVHKNAGGNLAVVAVLLEPGMPNPLMDRVWTYMPLDVGDLVRMPAGVLDVNELLPKDQRYFQFMGSLTTPPCTEGVLWMVLKQPVQLSKDQIKLFQQLYLDNARPVQPINARVVREAQ